MVANIGTNIGSIGPADAPWKDANIQTNTRLSRVVDTALAAGRYPDRKIGQFVTDGLDLIRRPFEAAKDAWKDRQEARADAAALNALRETLREGLASYNKRLAQEAEEREVNDAIAEEHYGRAFERDYAAAQRENDTFEAERQGRIWDDPKTLADHAEWMTSLVAENDRLDLNPDPGKQPQANLFAWDATTGSFANGTESRTKEPVYDPWKDENYLEERKFHHKHFGPDRGAEDGTIDTPDEQAQVVAKEERDDDYAR